MPRIVIAAGGTAGHVVPALAVADALRALGAEVEFVGGERAEAELVPAAGYPFHRLRVEGIDRRNPLKAVWAVCVSIYGTGTAHTLLRRIGADAVLGGGGYVAAPVGLAARALGLPLVLTEADSHLGLTNRMLAPLARRIFLAFPIEGRSGPKWVVSGRPVPAGTGRADRAAARARFGIDPDERCVLVFGGSLGARRLNHAALDAFGTAAPGAVLHASGRRDHEDLRRRLDELGSPPHYHLHPYVEPFADALAAADLVVARAGGGIHELLVAGLPAVLVPYPHATADHQAKNARWAEDVGAAVVVPDAEVDGPRLAREVAALLGAPQRMAAMARAATAAARPDAAERIAYELMTLAKDATGAPFAGRSLHFVGIGGAGMSGLALVAQALGARVTGSDRAESPYCGRLRAAGVEPAIGHDAANYPPGAELVVSTAIPEDNPELSAGRAAGATVLHRGDLLGELSRMKRTIAVSGTHGKTTTASMAAHVLRETGRDPGFLIGGELRSAGTNAGWGAGEWAVIEADESDRSFLKLHHEVAVVTNIELDHHATYATLTELERAFAEFVKPAELRIVGPDVELGDAGNEDESEVRVAIEPAAGAHPASRRAHDLCAQSLELLPGGSRFEVEGIAFELGVPGRHNVLNALAALAACRAAGVEPSEAARPLAGFTGAVRRFEEHGRTPSGALIFDDYAHHPTEVRATLEAARNMIEGGCGRVVACFQPHLYSRTRLLAREFGSALALADLVVVVEIYPARESAADFPGVSGLLVAQAAADAAGGRPVWWLPRMEDAERMLAAELREGDLLLTLGAGDVDQLAGRLAG